MNDFYGALILSPKEKAAITPSTGTEGEGCHEEAQSQNPLEGKTTEIDGGLETTDNAKIFQRL